QRGARPFSNACRNGRRRRHWSRHDSPQPRLVHDRGGSRAGRKPADRRLGSAASLTPGTHSARDRASSIVQVILSPSLLQLHFTCWPTLSSVDVAGLPSSRILVAGNTVICRSTSGDLTVTFS